MANIAQGAFAPIAASTELVVAINPYNLGFSELIGSHIMLEAEGIIPEGFEWPDGYDDLHWQAGQFDYWLHRARPPGAKGPRKAFAEVDWFCLRIELTHQPSNGEREIARKAQELKDTIYRHSPQGEREWNNDWNRYMEACGDEKFQEFKALIPGLVRPRPGRPPKNSEQFKGAPA